jgi:excisionase family DNA binding protein
VRSMADSKKATASIAEQPAFDHNLKWLTVDEAAHYLRVGSHTIRHTIHAGELKAAKFGQGYRIDRADLDQLLLRKKRVIAPYRRGTRPWVAKRHAENRRKRAAR